jgi:Holliday junction resolvasome RuvABC ATP-dependent DNA helicase subunit
MATETKGSKKAAAADRNPARAVAETAVDFPVGVVLGATERLTDLVEPFTDRSGADKQLKSYRTQLRRTIKRTERRGTTARRKATREVQKTRTQVEKRVRSTLEAQTSRAQELVDQVGERLPVLR